MSGNRQTGGVGLGLNLADGNEQLTVFDVTANGPAALVGLQTGDEIYSLAGQPVRSRQQFDTMLREQARRESGNRVWRIPVVVRRNGLSETLYWTPDLLARAGYIGRAAMEPQSGSAAMERRSGYRGSPTDMNTNPQRRAVAGHAGFLGVDTDARAANGALVTRVHPGTAAAQAGLLPGDVIWSLNGKPVTSADALAETISQMQPGQLLTIRFNRPTSQTAEIVLGERGVLNSTPNARQATQPIDPVPRDNQSPRIGDEPLSRPESLDDSSPERRDPLRDDDATEIPGVSTDQNVETKD